MDIKEYEALAWETAIYPNAGTDLTYPALGLCGEAGEVAEKVKKILRDKGGVVTDEDRKEIAKELGDVCWYLNALAHTLGVPLSDILQANVDKLRSRKERQVLQGSGDNR